MPVFHEFTSFVIYHGVEHVKRERALGKSVRGKMAAVCDVHNFFVELLCTLAPCVVCKAVAVGRLRQLGCV